MKILDQDTDKHEDREIESSEQRFKRLDLRVFVIGLGFCFAMWT